MCNKYKSALNIYGVNPIQPSLLDNKYHYVYRITNLVTGMHYYGKRSSSNHPYNDLGTRYFSSSSKKEFIQEQKTNPHHFKYKVVGVYTTSEQALQAEVKLHTKFNVSENQSFLNIARQTNSTFKPIGLNLAKDSVTGEYIGPVPKSDSRWNTGEIVNIQRGTRNAVCSTTHRKLGKVDTNDPRWNTGEILCEQVGATQAICSKTKEYLGFIPIDDPRWHTGEIVHINKGMITAYCSKTNQSLGKVHLDDPRWDTGEIYNNYCKTASAFCTKTNQSLGRVSVEDPRWKTGEICGTTKNQKLRSVTAIEVATGKKLKKVPIDDPRWATGEIIEHRSPYARITNGTEERVYKVDGSDTIPEGWWVCFSTVILADIYCADGTLVAHSVHPKSFQPRILPNAKNPNGLTITIKRNSIYQGYYAKILKPSTMGDFI
jgi:hypothetical protein